MAGSSHITKHNTVFFFLIAILPLTNALEMNDPLHEAHSRKLRSSCRMTFDPNLKASKFPKDFVFGAATSAFQVEGASATDGRGPSIWDEFTATPGKIKDGGNASVAADSYHKYAEDVKLLQSIGVKSYRFSISWSRVLPTGTGKVNQRGIQYYNDLINALLAANITPAVTLYHWDLPLALHLSMGGWLNQSIVPYFVEYAQLAFKSFGDRVKTWITFNEPQQTAVSGYSAGFFAPGMCSDRGHCQAGNSSTDAYTVGHNILLSHAAAVQLYRGTFQAVQGGKIGITIDSQHFYPATNSTADRKAASTAQQFAYGWFGDPIMFGHYPAVMRRQVGSRLPVFTKAERKLLKGSVDFLGVNCYTGSFAGQGQLPAPGTGYPWTDSWAWTSHERKGLRIGAKTASSWLSVVPQSIYHLTIWISRRYGSVVPMLITENGMSDRGDTAVSDLLCDKTRVAFYESYLRELLKAIKAGANVQGYFAWSLMDNFEWASGYSERFGLHYVDFSDPRRTRVPKLSSSWWSSFTRA